MLQRGDWHCETVIHSSPTFIKVKTYYLETLLLAETTQIGKKELNSFLHTGKKELISFLPLFFGLLLYILS